MPGYSSSPPSPQYAVPHVSPCSYAAYAPQHPVYGAAPTYAVPSLPVQMVSPQMPVYTPSGGGMPVNLRGGGVLTEARGIFISNLSYKAGPSDLLALLSRVARPVDYKMYKDPRTGHFKGSATAKFATKEEAQATVAHLNQTMHMGMVINVRPDTERTPVGQVQAPVIVNGSGYSRVNPSIIGNARHPLTHGSTVWLQCRNDRHCLMTKLEGTAGSVHGSSRVAAARAIMCTRAVAFVGTLRDPGT